MFYDAGEAKILGRQGILMRVTTARNQNLWDEIRCELFLLEDNRFGVARKDTQANRSNTTRFLVQSNDEVTL